MDFLALEYVVQTPIVVGEFLLSLISIPPPPDIFAFMPLFDPFIALGVGLCVWFVFFGIVQYYLWRRIGLYSLFGFLALINLIPLSLVYYISSAVPYAIVSIAIHWVVGFISRIMEGKPLLPE
jgi:hypothetical protein